MMGIIADRKVSKEKLMIFSASMTILMAYSLFLILEKDLSLSTIIFVQAIIGIMNAGFVAPSMALLSTFFPVHERYSGIGFGYALGGALLGGTTPLIVASLVNWLDSPLVPAYYLMFSGVLGITCVIWEKKGDTNSPILSRRVDELPSGLRSA